MKNLTRGLTLLLLSTTALLSCQKGVSDIPLPFPITVYATSVKPQYNMRMFVGGVEITDTIKIKNYFSDVPLKLRSSSILTSFPASYTFKAPDSLQYVSNVNAVYTHDSATGKHVITFSNFSPVDPLKGSFDVTKFYKYPNTSVAVSGGFNITGTIVGYGSYTSFKIPVLNYKYRKPSNSFTSTGLINNEFNSVTLSTLAPNDTIAVQEFYLYYTAKSNY